jgi:ribosome-associated protein
LNEGVAITPQLTIPWHELHFKASRASGPGGQHVNTADTRIELRWNVQESAVLTDRQRIQIVQALAGRINRQGELVLTCDTRRSQHRNRQEVIQRLGQLVRRAVAPRRRRVPTVPSAEARERRLRDKRIQAERKRRRQRPDDSE